MLHLKTRLKRASRLAANITAYPLSGLSPRSSKQWAFGHAGEMFAGNPKYLFLWIALYRPDIQATWLTSNERLIALLRRHGYSAARRRSIKGIRIALRSGVFAFSHGINSVNFPLSRGAFLLNLWHGVGLKSIQFGRHDGTSAHAKKQAKTAWHRLKYLNELKSFDAVVTTSDMMQKHFASQFEQPMECFPQIGYPRLDCAVDRQLQNAALNLDRDLGFNFNADNFQEVYLYVPTYRDTNRPFFEEAIPDMARLSAILRERNALLYIKPHPQTLAAFSSLPSNVRIWPAEIDCQTYLDTIDALITDYSSVLYDYLEISPNPALLYTFDLDEYLTGDRELLFPFEEHTTGFRAFNYDTFCEAIQAGVPRNNTWHDDKLRLHQEFWSGSQSPASPAIIKHVEDAFQHTKS